MAKKTETPESTMIGSKAPAFALPDQDGKVHKLADYKGQWVVLYTYPKDDTCCFFFAQESSSAYYDN